MEENSFLESSVKIETFLMIYYINPAYESTSPIMLINELDRDLHKYRIRAEFHADPLGADKIRCISYIFTRKISRIKYIL